MKHKLIDGRYIRLKDLRKRINLMGINKSEHILKSKADYIEVYNKYIHNEVYSNKISQLLINDYNLYMTNKKKQKPKPKLKDTTTHQQNLETPLTFGPIKKSKRKGTMERLDDELNLLLSKKEKQLERFRMGTRIRKEVK